MTIAPAIALSRRFAAWHTTWLSFMHMWLPAGSATMHHAMGRSGAECTTLSHAHAAQVLQAEPNEAGGVDDTKVVMKGEEEKKWRRRVSKRHVLAPVRDLFLHNTASHAAAKSHVGKVF